LTQIIQKVLGYEKCFIDTRIFYFKPTLATSERTFAQEIKESLNQNLKSISPKYFYNEEGSRLFQEICKLPEYYLTRTEIGLLKKLRNDLKKHLDGNFRLVELGSGSAVKTRLILDILHQNQDKVEYFPIDISNIIKQSSKNLQRDYQKLQITAIKDTYEKGLELIQKFEGSRILLAFLGSSFGNFEPEDGCNFLKKILASMNENDFLFLGLDLVKDKKILENAYNDSKGTTAKFNLNILSHINEELGGNFDLTKFVHLAHYNEDKQRIEIYLKSLEKQTVYIKGADLSLKIKKDELIHTEHSHKYTISQIKNMMQNSGFNINQIWKDENNHYALVLVSKNNR